MSKIDNKSNIFHECFSPTISVIQIFREFNEFLKILNTLSQENVFIISHKSDLSVDKFDNLIRFEKRQQFTHLTS